MEKIQTSFYSPEELKEIGFKSVGENVLISRKVSIYSPQKISIGNNVRIDDFCILSGNITLGNYCRIAAYCALSMPARNFLNLPVLNFRFQAKKYINRSRRLRPSCGPSFCKNPPAGLQYGSGAEVCPDLP